MSEQWRPIAGFDGYEISDQGRVRSWRGMGRRPQRPKKPTIIVPQLRDGGHLCVVLRQGGGYRGLTIDVALRDTWGIERRTIRKSSRPKGAIA